MKYIFLIIIAPLALLSILAKKLEKSWKEAFEIWREIVLRHYD